jgi:chaperonin cofactor prefoldin
MTLLPLHQTKLVTELAEAAKSLVSKRESLKEDSKDTFQQLKDLHETLDKQLPNQKLGLLERNKMIIRSARYWVSMR